MPPDDEITNTATDVDTTVVSPLAKPARLEPGSKLGRYQIGEEIGAGGMGVVYRARDPELNRDVAIKVVGSQGGRSQERLLAEARAMAKLDHPSLMPVFDVGAIESGVFVVMPYLTGGTLHDWIHAEPRAWQEVLKRFIKAGRGLAAAHATGLVHRDFKPRNVMLDGDDVLVADFGLVAGAAGASEGAPIHASTIGGTPGYMAPEQARGETVDARADQFSFCISLWEGLHGERPQEAETRTHAALSKGATPPVPPDRRGSPTWLRRGLARGFASQADQRWPSMTVLLDRLERRRGRRLRVAVGVGVVAVIGLAAVWALPIRGEERGPACVAPDERLVGTWDADVHARIATAFATIDARSAADVTQRVASAADAYASAWKSMHVEACRAAHVLRTDTPDILDRRMHCLDRRLTIMRTLTTTLAEASNRDVMQRAIEHVHALPRIADCADRARLMAVAAAPTDAAVRTRIAEIEAELDNIEALRFGGAHLEQLRRAEAAVASARTTGDAAILARSLHALTRAQGDNGMDDVEATRELAKVAAAARLDDLSARAWLELLNKLTSGKALYDEARALEEAARAAVVRAGSTDELRFLELFYGAARAGNSGEYKLARERYEMALPLASTPNQRADVEVNLAKMKFQIDGPSAALPHALASVKSYEALFGPEHAALSDPLIFLAQVLRMKGDAAQARSVAQRALAIQDRAVSRDSGDRAMTLETLGKIERDLGNDDEAERLIEGAAELFERSGDTSRLASALDALAKLAMANEGLTKARPLHERALAALVGGMGKESFWYANLEMSYAESLILGGECGEARPLLTHAAAILEKERHGHLGDIYWLRALCLFAEEKWEASMVELERAEAICRTSDCNSVAEVRWSLGVLLVERGGDRARGMKLIEDARARWVTMGWADRVQQADAWLQKNR